MEAAMNIKKWIIHRVKNVAARNSYHVVPDWHIADHAFVEHLKRLFAMYKIDCVVDVGANVGQYAALLRERVGYEGLILSFEPVVAIFNELSRKSAADVQWRVFNIALGAARGTATINVTKAPSRNSLLQPRTDVVSKFWSEDAVHHTEEIRIETVDDILTAEGIDPGSSQIYLKMDTQGYDLDVLRGATRTIAKIAALQTEASVRPIYHGMPTYEEMLRFTGAAGFEMSGLFTVSLDEFLRIVEFDCVMVNALRNR